MSTNEQSLRRRGRNTRKAFRCALILAFCVGATAVLPTRAAESPPTPELHFDTVVGAGGVPLNVVTRGDPSKPAIVLIHGFRQSYLSWQGLLASSALTGYHLVAYDLRGHGNSGVPWDPAAYADPRLWADDLEAVLVGEKVERAVFVGWSFGGDVLMDYVRAHGTGRVAGFVLVSTTAHVTPPPPPPASPPTSRGPRPLRPTESPDLTANLRAVRASVDYVFGEGVPASLREDSIAIAMRVSPYVDRGIAARGIIPNADLVPRLTMPVKLVFGAKDRIVPAADAQAVQAVFPTASVTIYPDAAHAPFITEPERFARELAAFVDRVSAGATPTHH